MNEQIVNSIQHNDGPPSLGSLSPVSGPGDFTQPSTPPPESPETAPSNADVPGLALDDAPPEDPVQEHPRPEQSAPENSTPEHPAPEQPAPANPVPVQPHQPRTD